VEYMANTQATKEAIWIKKLMMDLIYMEEKENDGDSMRQSRCDIIDQKSHSPCMNKTH
jgi:hypothetical protein